MLASQRRRRGGLRATLSVGSQTTAKRVMDRGAATDPEELGKRASKGCGKRLTKSEIVRSLQRLGKR